jgi:hypothetical protein
MEAALRQNWRDEDSYGDITGGMDVLSRQNWRTVVLARNWRDDGFTYIFRQYSRS